MAKFGKPLIAAAALLAIGLMSLAANGQVVGGKDKKPKVDPPKIVDPLKKEKDVKKEDDKKVVKDKDAKDKKLDVKDTSGKKKEPAKPGAETGIDGQVAGFDEKGVSLGNVVGARLEFKNAVGKVVATATTDKTGRFKVNLPKGEYSYKLQAVGFKESTGPTVHKEHLTRTHVKAEADKDTRAKANIAAHSKQNLPGLFKKIDATKLTLAERKVYDHVRSRLELKAKTPDKTFAMQRELLISTHRKTKYADMEFGRFVGLVVDLEILCSDDPAAVRLDAMSRLWQVRQTFPGVTGVIAHLAAHDIDQQVRDAAALHSKNPKGDRYPK